MELRRITSPFGRSRYGFTKDTPLHVRAQLLAPNRAGGEPLDLRAVLSRHAPTWVLPLSDSGFRHAKGCGKRNLRADNPRRAL